MVSSLQGNHIVKKFLCCCGWLAGMTIVLVASFAIKILDIVVAFFAAVAASCYQYGETGEWKWKPDWKSGR